MKLWVGNEQEGEYKGIKTLFIGTPNVTSEEIITLVNKYNIEQVYFGAGKCSKINEVVLNSIIKYVIEQLAVRLITIEVDVKGFNKLIKNNLIEKYCNIILTFNNKEFSILKQLDNYSVQIKLQNLKGDKSIVLFNLTEMMSVKLSKHIDKIYKGDKIIR